MKKLFLLIAGMFLITFLNAQTFKIHVDNVSVITKIDTINPGAVIKTEFKTLPAGYCDINGRFVGNGQYGYWSGNPGVSIGITWNWCMKVHNTSNYNIGFINHKNAVAVLYVKHF